MQDIGVVPVAEFISATLPPATSLGLPSAVVRKAVYSMKRRCKELKENGGYLIKGD